MPLINPPIDREFCDFCRDLAAIFFHFWPRKVYSLSNGAFELVVTVSLIITENNKQRRTSCSC